MRVVVLKGIGADTAGLEFGDGPLFPHLQLRSSVQAGEDVSGERGSV